MFCPSLLGTFFWGVPHVWGIFLRSVFHNPLDDDPPIEDDRCSEKRGNDGKMEEGVTGHLCKKNDSDKAQDNLGIDSDEAPAAEVAEQTRCSTDDHRAGEDDDDDDEGGDGDEMNVRVQSERDSVGASKALGG